jgi:hypothetical protein
MSMQCGHCGRSYVGTEYRHPLCESCLNDFDSMPKLAEANDENVCVGTDVLIKGVVYTDIDDDAVCVEVILWDGSKSSRWFKLSSIAVPVSK